MSAFTLSGRVIVVALLSLVPAFACAEPPDTPGLFDQRRLLTTLNVSMAGLQAYDTYSTLTVLNRGGVESNPLVEGITGHPAAFIALKAGVTTASIYAAERLWREHHRGTAIALMAATNALLAVVAVHNASVLNGTVTRR